MKFLQIYQSILNGHASAIQRIGSSDKIKSSLETIGNILLTTLQDGHKILLCGNGGSAADAQHIATELVSRFYLERKALDAEALTVNSSSITAIANDYSFDHVFARQVDAKGKPGDVLIGIITSGTSKNILAAFEAGKRIGLKNICFTGEKAAVSLNELCDVVLRVPSTCTPRIQEAHILIGHILCEYVEQEMFGQE